MDRFQGASAFVAVAQAGGFSAAARSLGIPLPTISRRVAKLESDLGVRLLHRTTRRVELTEQGQSYYAACRRLLEDLRDAEEAITGEYRTPRGDLTVTAPTGFGRLHLQPIVWEFLAAYPEINLKLVLVDRIVNLVDEHIDAALRISDLPDSALVARPLGHIRMMVCAGPKYLQERGTPTHPSELLHHDCIAWSALGANPSWWFREAGTDRTYPIRVRLTATFAESATAAAQAGLGITQVTSYQSEHGLQTRTLARILSSHECAPTAVSLVYASHRLAPLKLRAFLDFAAPRLTARLAAMEGMLERA